MIKAVIFICSLFLTSAWAQESEWNKAFNIIWESRWQETGIPMTAVRWPHESKSIKFSINKTASSSNANRTREAIGVITQVLDWKATEVDEGSADAQIEITIRQFSPEEMTKPCYASGSWRSFLYTKQKLTLSEQVAYRCVLHELMHAFGFPGHPQGDTVLSYFEGNRSGLKPMDVFLLQAWYSDSIKPGVSPFITVNDLTRLWVNKQVPQDQLAKALEAQQRWYQGILKSMEEFALGKGEPPTILFRSGRLSDDGVRFGRANMQGMLGAAYLNGWTLERDLPKAARLLLMGAQAGNSGAAGILARQLKMDTWQITEAKPMCAWLNATSVTASKISADDHKAALESNSCKQVSN
jgi:hypothetical protein